MEDVHFNIQVESIRIELLKLKSKVSDQKYSSTKAKVRKVLMLTQRPIAQRLQRELRRHGIEL